MKNIEKELCSNLLWIYTSDDFYIEPSIIGQIYKHISNMKLYEKITLVIDTRGGNLATGYKIVRMLQEKFQEINSIVVERCSSTGTFIILSSSQVYLSPFAVITPTEPQMNAYDYGNISVNVIKKYLNNVVDNKLDPVIYGTYLSVIDYFKDLCYSIFESDKAAVIVNFMLNKVNSHEYPLSKRELENLFLKINDIPLNLEKIYKVHSSIKKYLNDKCCYENRKVIIISNNLITVYRKRYSSDKKKLDEGYIDFEGDVFMESKNFEVNGRISDILEDAIRVRENREYKDAYNDRHWDSYNDSCYHDYGDNSVYHDYGDNSVYHDSYKDYGDSYSYEDGV